MMISLSISLSLSQLEKVLQQGEIGDCAEPYIGMSDNAKVTT